MATNRLFELLLRRRTPATAAPAPETPALW